MRLANRPSGLDHYELRIRHTPADPCALLMGSGASMIRSGRPYPRSAVDYYHAVIFIHSVTGYASLGPLCDSGLRATSTAMIAH